MTMSTSHGALFRSGRGLAVGAAVAAALLGAVRGAGAQTRTVSGRVVDVESGNPVHDVQIAIRGAVGRGTATGDDGTFSLALPSSDVTLVMHRIGYAMREVRVAASTETVTVVMKHDALQLDQVVVTGHATSMSRRNLANSVASVDAADITRVPAATIEHALQGKVAGAQIQQNSGAPGGGNRIRLRGTSSILGNAQPLYVIDGVIASDVAIAPGTNRVTRAAGSASTAIVLPSQENPVNRIADISADDIENIEVLKGAAAAAIYGSKASGGVVMITTHRGRIGRPQFNLRSGVGTSRLAYKEGSRHFKSLADAQATFGTRDTTFWRAAWNPDNNFSYEDLLFGEKPSNYETALSVSGGADNTRYFVSTLLKRDDGIVKNTFADKKSLRVNLDQNIGSRLTVSAGAELMRNSADRGLFGNDNVGNSIYYTVTKLPSFYDFRPRPDGSYPVNPFYPSNPFQTIDLVQNRELVWRAINTGRVAFDAFNSDRQQLRFIALGGVDVFTQRNNIYSPPELQYEDDDGRLGTAVASYAQNVQYNLNLNGVHVLTPRSWMSLSSQLGTQTEVRDLDQTRTVGENLLGGLAVPDAGTVRDIDIDRLRVVDFGVFAQSEALFWERLLLTAGVRADRSSNNGDVGKFYFFPKFASSYRMPDLRPGIVDELKLRVAYGESGNQPPYGQKFTTLGSGVIGGQGGFTFSPTRGDANIGPERQRELEGGIDAALLGDRAELELTGFQRDISQLLIQHTLAPTSGFSSEVYNGAAMRVRGVEASINAFPVQTSSSGGLTWNTRVNFATNRSTITRLPVPAFLLGTPLVGAIQIKQGQSTTRLVGFDTVAVAGTCPAKALDLSGCDTVGRAVAVYMGDGNPEYNAGFGNEIRWRRLSLYALAERQKGGMLAAGTWRHFDLGKNSRDYDAPSPDTTKTLGKWRTDTYLRVTRIYYQDVSYWKLRELTVAYEIPQRYTKTMLGRASSARVSAGGRNLKTWTKFRGGDPDFANYGQPGISESLQRNRELAAYPASRQYWVTVQLSF